MDRQFQNRLVGTIVLVALGVIFLPDLLDGKKALVLEEFTEIPLRPVIEVKQQAASEPQSFDVPEIAKTQDLGAQDASQSVSANSGTNPVSQSSKSTQATDDAPSHQQAQSKPEAKPEVKLKPVVQSNNQAATQPVANDTPSSTKAVTAGYTLQLGAFRNANSVSALIAQLRLSGYTAYTVPEKPVQGKLTRVFVGPELNKSKLEQAITPIFKLTNVKGQVVPYNPTEQ